MPTFSICHATARVPNGWRASHDAWMANADDPDQVEYVLIASEAIAGVPCLVMQGSALISYNTGAAVSDGQILIAGADDFFPPPHWDTRLLDILWVKCAITPAQTDEQFVIHVSTGSPRDASLISHPILSRAVYDRWGYFFYPEYESVYADDDLTEHAYQDGLVIDAKELVFEHRHHSFGKSVEDDVYRKQNRPEAYAIGAEVLARRRADRFAK